MLPWLVGGLITVVIAAYASDDDSEDQRRREKERERAAARREEERVRREAEEKRRTAQRAEILREAEKELSALFERHGVTVSQDERKAFAQSCARGSSARTTFDRHYADGAVARGHRHSIAVARETLEAREKALTRLVIRRVRPTR